MSWDELRAAASEGVEIGCHTETHPILSRLSNRLELEREIRGAKEHLEECLGFDVRHFCYPNGHPIDIGEAAIRRREARPHDPQLHPASPLAASTRPWTRRRVRQ